MILAKKLLTLDEVDKRLSDSIGDIRSCFPDASNYIYSQDNPIAQSLGLDISEQTGICEDGYIVENQVVINGDITYMERKNFSLFHEIAHYLISNDDEIISSLMEYHAGKEEGYKRYIESLCNYGAGEFLAPLDEIKAYLDGKKFSIILLKELDHLFPASKPAIVFQLARAASHKCTIVIVDQGFSSGIYDQQLSSLKKVPFSGVNYYILYSTTSKRNKYRPGRFTVIPKHHILWNAFREKSMLRGTDFIPYKSGNKNHLCDCEAMYYQGKVFGLFNIEQPVNNRLQPKLL